MEYLKLDPSEQQYGKKHLLNSEMGVLNMMRRASEFNKLRKAEFDLKSLFKKKMNEITLDLEEIDKMLPKMKIEQVKEPKVRDSNYRKKREELEVEIEEIKQKLSLLGN